MGLFQSTRVGVLDKVAIRGGLVSSNIAVGCRGGRYLSAYLSSVALLSTSLGGNQRALTGDHQLELHYTPSRDEKQQAVTALSPSRKSVHRPSPLLGKVSS
jgi:hypothetical protein